MGPPERKRASLELGSEMVWVSTTEKLKAVVRIEVDDWLKRVTQMPTSDEEPRVETFLDQLNERLLNHLLRFQDFRETWLKARKKPENFTNK